MSIRLISEHFEESLEDIQSLSNENLKKIVQYILVQIDKRFVDELRFYVKTNLASNRRRIHR
jgi:hypothetical protein